MLTLEKERFAPARYRRETACRACGEPALRPFLDLGLMPFADRLIEAGALGAPEPAAPLEAAFCEACSLVQILDTVAPEDLFDHAYPYYSSFSPALLAHSRENALDLLARRRLGADSLVVELASNDGYLLKNYVESGVPVLGVDPASGPVAAAQKAGVRTIKAFFTEDYARELRKAYGPADIIHGNNVLAHVADTTGFVRGIAHLLKDDGVAVIEAPYVRDLIDHTEFDTIYHEHLCYFSVTALDKLFRRCGLFLNDVKRLAIHGGSLRLYVGKTEEASEAARALLEEEARMGVDRFGYYRDFGARVEALGAALRETLAGLRREGKRVAAYGAAAKGATLINFIGEEAAAIEFVVDRNTHKHGKHMPGLHLPIRPVEALMSETPDYALMLAWNFAEEILEQQAAWRAKGGRFIIPIPTPRIV